MAESTFDGDNNWQTIVVNPVLVASLIVPNIILIFTEDYPVGSNISGMILLVGLYTIWAHLSRRSGVMVWLSLPLIALVAFEMILLYIYRGSVISANMFTNLLTTNCSEARELLGSIYPAIIVVCTIYFSLLWFASREIANKHLLPSSYRRRAIRNGFLLFVFGVVSLIVTTRGNIAHAMRYEIFPLNAIYNAYVSGKELVNISNFNRKSGGFVYNAHRVKRIDNREIYVYIIGEASRACSWQLFGYDRKTNPRLSKRSDLILYDNVLTHSNTTHKSVPMMLSSVKPTEHKELYCRRGLAALFNEAGFSTCFISNQTPNRAMIEHLASDADTTIYLSKLRYDMQLLEQMQHQIMRHPNEDMLFILHCYGSHFNYNCRYPRHYATFLPDLQMKIESENSEQLTNAYDNTIIYTDHFLASVIDYLESMEGCCSAMVYCADHGEDLYDDERRCFLHSSPKTTYYQLHVASLAWFSEDYKQQFPIKVMSALKNRHMPATTSSMFHTMADVGSITGVYVDGSMSLVSPQFNPSHSRYYLNDHNQAIPFSASGLEERDYYLFRCRGIDIGQ